MPWPVPFTRLPSFIGREAQLDQLNAHISKEGCQPFHVCGLDGCRKTALALELFYRLKEQQPSRAIFWLSAVSRESFEQAYGEIWILLNKPKILEDKADTMRLVKAILSDNTFGQLLLIVDNTDDTNVLLEPLGRERGTDRLIDFLPCSCKGSIIFTTRSESMSIDLAGSNVLELGKLQKSEAKDVMKTPLVQKHRNQLEDQKTVDEFLDILAFLPLAIVQAVAFINKNNSTISDYISLYRDSEQAAADLLSTEFEDDNRRYGETKNPIATTWYTSFEHIRKQNEDAAHLMCFMACTAHSDIPLSMLPVEGSKVQQAESIGMLKAYAFIIERQSHKDSQHQRDRSQRPAKAFDVHPLVHWQCEAE